MQVIRKLRWNLSIYKEGEDFVIDTTKQRHSMPRAEIASLE